MTRIAADVQAEIDAHQARDREWFDAAEAELDATPHGPAWDAQNWLLRRRLVDSVAKNDALTAERDRLAREELDAATSERNRGWAMALREAWLGQDPFAELDEDDYLTNRDLERLEAWKRLPLDEAQRWARVANALGRGWY